MSAVSGIDLRSIPRWRPALPLALQCAGHAVADGEQREVDALVLPELGVERTDRLGVSVLVGEVGDRSAPDDVVDQQQPAAAHQFQAALVVGVVVGLVGIDEGEIELAAKTLGQQPVECLECRGYGELDAALQSGLLPVALADAGPLLADIAAP